jgi:hypothetical protein
LPYPSEAGKTNTSRRTCCRALRFIGHPLTVADDIGSDFVCTIFEPKRIGKTDRLFPRRSFAIQIKSNRERIRATNKIDYLFGLELPFFVGVVQRTPSLQLSIFSGDFIPSLFSYYGWPSTLSLVLVPSGDTAKPYEGTAGGPCTIRLRHACDLLDSDSDESFREKATTLSALCKRMHGNVSARALNEFVFKFEAGREPDILAGEGSVEVFRDNFCLRLAEVFRNLDWILSHHLPFDRAEFGIYDRLYRDMVSLGRDLPPVLKRAHSSVKDKLG